MIPDLAAALDGALGPFPVEEPGVAIGVASHGEVVYRRAHGLADVARGVRLEPSTPMAIGSATKHLTCLAYLLLCEEGRASVDDPIALWLPELHPTIHAVSVRQLMGHVSGLVDAYELTLLFNGLEGRATAEEVLRLYRTPHAGEREPGLAWRYNNGAYMLLGTIVERLAGQPLETVLRERIFAPAGLDGTRLDRFDDTADDRTAASHVPTAEGGWRRALRSIEALGQGGVVSTVDDMLRWLGGFARPLVGSEASWRLLTTPGLLADGAATGYGLGLRRAAYRGVDILHHPGAVVGGNAQMIHVPAFGLDVIVLANRQDLSALGMANTILDVCLVDDLDAAAPIGPDALPTLTGAWEAPAGVRAVIEPCGQMITTGPHGSAVFDLQPLAERLWRATAAGAPPLAGVLTVDEDGRGFRFGNPRVRAFPFTRISERT